MGLTTDVRFLEEERRADSFTTPSIQVVLRTFFFPGIKQLEHEADHSL
jgi:hypothetical protein